VGGVGGQCTDARAWWRRSADLGFSNLTFCGECVRDRIGWFLLVGVVGISPHARAQTLRTRMSGKLSYMTTASENKCAHMRWCAHVRTMSFEIMISISVSA
jgi:hypothetical protein